MFLDLGQTAQCFTHPRGMHGRRHTSGCPTLPELKEQALMPLMLRAKSRSPLASPSKPRPGWDESSWTLYASRIWCVISSSPNVFRFRREVWTLIPGMRPSESYTITKTTISWTFLSRSCSFSHFKPGPRCSAQYICELFLAAKGFRFMVLVEDFPLYNPPSENLQRGIYTYSM